MHVNLICARVKQHTKIFYEIFYAKVVMQIYINIKYYKYM